ncbi:MAG: amino acid ABC transporter permease [Lentilitoribacter sp.]
MEFRFFEIYREPEYLFLLAEGVGTSIFITLLAGVFGFILATFLALSRYWEVPVIKYISAGYVEFIRNTPLIVQMFFVAFGLPLLLGYEWPFWAHAVFALTLNFSGYFAEILRSSFRSISHHQNEAAASLGLPPRTTFWKVLFPQAIAVSFPSLNSQFIFLFLTTGIISEIGVRDLTYAGLFIDSRTFRSFEVFITLTCLYIGIAVSFKASLAWLHDKLFPWTALR